MSTILWKNIHLCVPKFKCLPTNLSPPPVNDDDVVVEVENLSQINFHDNAALIKNFNSIYDTSANSAGSTTTSTSKSVAFSTTEDNRFSSSEEDSDDYNIDCIPDFSTVFASQRFFFSSPGKSNSIIDSPPEIMKLPLVISSPPPPPPVENDIKSVSEGVVAIQTYSPDPYADFRRSMQEMVEAHELRDLKADWDYLHELLLCYLSLNPKHTHKLIIGAFTDLIVSLTSSSSSSSSNPNPGHWKTDVEKHHCTTSRQLLA